MPRQSLQGEGTLHRDRSRLFRRVVYIDSLPQTTAHTTPRHKFLARYDARRTRLLACKRARDEKGRNGTH